MSLNFYNDEDDISLGQVDNLKGADVFFSIGCHTKKKLESVFTEYANEDYEFDKSKSVVKISSGKAAVSRSQARRLFTQVLLANLSQRLSFKVYEKSLYTYFISHFNCYRVWC